MHCNHAQKGYKFLSFQISVEEIPILDPFMSYNSERSCWMGFYKWKCPILEEVDGVIDL